MLWYYIYSTLNISVFDLCTMVRIMPHTMVKYCMAMPTILKRSNHFLCFRILEMQSLMMPYNLKSTSYCGS